jgi:hypothetical protein
VIFVGSGKTDFFVKLVYLKMHKKIDFSKIYKNLKEKSRRITKFTFFDFSERLTSIGSEKIGYEIICPIHIAH